MESNGTGFLKVALETFFDNSSPILLISSFNSLFEIKSLFAKWNTTFIDNSGIY